MGAAKDQKKSTKYNSIETKTESAKNSNVVFFVLFFFWWGGSNLTISEIGTWILDKNFQHKKSFRLKISASKS